MRKYSVSMILAIIIICFQNQVCAQAYITRSFTVDSLGACQGAFVLGDTVYLYGDRECGIVRAYQKSGDSLQYLHKELKLTINGKDLINHPTGFAFYNADTVFIGNSIRLDKEGKKWKAFIYCIDWKASLQTGTLDGHIINIIEDDACIQGTRPLMVNYNHQRFLATSDYGPVNNEVRLYDPVKLFHAKHSSETGTLQYRFRCLPWVQNLAFVPGTNQLMLIRNTTEGRGWQFNLLDLAASIRGKKAVYTQTVVFSPQSELEGFTFFKNGGIAVSSSRTDNVSFVELD